MKKVLAIDLGASSGRVMLGIYDGESIKVEELHRFSNDPVILNGTMYWDFLRLFHEIKQGLIKAKAYGAIDSLAVDTWGVDFGLLDVHGTLLENPVHYRDCRTKGMLEKSFQQIDKDFFYQLTGNQFMEINTVFQLLSLLKMRKDLLDRADQLLLMPDLFHYFLCGAKKSEYSIASTTQLLDARKKEWSTEIMEALEIPAHLFSDIVPCGTKLGQLQPTICEELGISPIEVIAIAGHDTQSALAAVPSNTDDFIFISCGTWSLFGTELEEPIIDERSAAFNITNEGSSNGKISFLKNIIGLWLIQESRRQWIREGKKYSFEHLEQMAIAAKPFQCFIDPDASEFVPAGNLPRRIQSFCKQTKQNTPQSEGSVVRCINESLAFKYRKAFEEIKICTGKDYSKIHMVGGGTRSRLLCQMTANACGCPVIAGPSEATVLGNIGMQLYALSAVGSPSQIRELITRSSEVTIYHPQDEKIWNEAYEKFNIKTAKEIS